MVLVTEQVQVYLVTFCFNNEQVVSKRNGFID